eukprot:CAMPEP_0206465152 /NCGR_PEP_ID=MMETSP0324_2-20121206/27657_1 /ASSEMBLY_ACC=CAM_ASM_000836 /TAXON_ID=2866 /ORGANISM="Crypthecodinium cohnii, Strain Seligo" /LENGTH=486 /DNA_ID=CAMNT_0053937951 /DNA_START=137 /DNA_END=1597 /DNA_ORIENTATION=+
MSEDEVKTKDQKRPPWGSDSDAGSSFGTTPLTPNTRRQPQPGVEMSANPKNDLHSAALLESAGGATSSGASRRSLRRSSRTELPTKLTKVLVAGMYIEAWNDEHFSDLRAKHKVKDNFLEGLNFGKLLDKASKSNEPLWITDDEDFVIKAMSGPDHTSMLGCTPAYMRRHQEGSVLVPIYLHFRFIPDSNGNHQDPAMGWQSYIAMRNIMPSHPDHIWRKRYDLKGCDDDKTLESEGKRIRAVHKRWWHWWYCQCCWSEERWLYWNGKQHARGLSMALPKALRDKFLKYLEGDVKWLMESGLMDYSLLLGVKRFPASVLEDDSDTFFNFLADYSAGRQTFLVRDLEVQRRIRITVENERDLTTGLEYRLAGEGLRVSDWDIAGAPKEVEDGPGPGTFPRQVEVTLLKKTRHEPILVITVGIVDFLQTWTLKKRLASCLKLFERRRATVPPDLYGERFLGHFRQILTVGTRLKQVTGCRSTYFDDDV